MIVFHAGVYDSQLLLWGETPVEPKALLARRLEQKRPQPLPYDAGAEIVGDAVLHLTDRLRFGQSGGRHGQNRTGHGDWPKGKIRK